MGFGTTTIGLRTDISPNDKVVVLSGASYARKDGPLGSWNKIRIGIRARARAGDANTLTYGDGLTPRFGVGLCNFASSVARRATAGHWVGVVTTGAVWTISSPGAGDFNLLFGNAAPAKKVGANFTIGTNFASAPAVCCGAEPTPVRLNQCLYFVDITKGSPNYSIRLFAIANPSNGGGQNRATYKAQMLLDPPTQVNYFYAAAQTVAVNEGTDGTLDAINIFNELPIELEIWDHGVHIIS